MKVVVILNANQVKKFIEGDNISDVLVIDVNDNLKENLSTFIEDNTGFSTKPVIGVSSIYGDVNVLDDWTQLYSFLNLKNSDFLLEFDIPKDLIATVYFTDLISMNSDESLLYEELCSKLSLNSHCGKEDIELSIVPLLSKQYCKRFVYVNDDWDIEDKDVKDIDELKMEFIQRFI